RSTATERRARSARPCRATVPGDRAARPCRATVPRDRAAWQWWRCRVGERASRDRTGPPGAQIREQGLVQGVEVPAVLGAALAGVTAQTKPLLRDLRAQLDAVSRRRRATSGVPRQAESLEQVVRGLGGARVVRRADGA